MEGQNTRSYKIFNASILDACSGSSDFSLDLYVNKYIVVL